MKQWITIRIDNAGVSAEAHVSESFTDSAGNHHHCCESHPIAVPDTVVATLESLAKDATAKAQKKIKLCVARHTIAAEERLSNPSGFSAAKA